MLYFGQGTATNSGVVGLDNMFPYLWLSLWPDLHDVPPYCLELRGETFVTPHPNNVIAKQGQLVTTRANVSQLMASLFFKNKKDSLLARTGAFQPFGKNAKVVHGDVKSSGTILRLNPDGSDLQVYAWGLRNPFGVMWGPDGQLYASDNGYDDRGSRPIGNACDNLWLVHQGAWYGRPDYSSGIPVTHPRFRPSRGTPPEFLMKRHPPVQKPLMTRPKHAGLTKMDFSISSHFGFEGQMFLGEVGAGTPITGPGIVPAGHQVARIDLLTGEVQPFFRAKEAALGPPGPMEYVLTPGPKRPTDVRFSPDGSALYVVDIGGLTAFPAGAAPFPRAFPGTGVVWRITPLDMPPSGPPADLSPVPPKAVPVANSFSPVLPSAR